MQHLKRLMKFQNGHPPEASEEPEVYAKEFFQYMLDDVKDNEEELEEFVKQLQDLENSPELAGVDLPAVEDLENLSPEELEKQANKLIDAVFEEIDEVSQWPPVASIEDASGSMGSTDETPVVPLEHGTGGSLVKPTLASAEVADSEITGKTPLETIQGASIRATEKEAHEPTEEAVTGLTNGGKSEPTHKAALELAEKTLLKSTRGIASDSTGKTPLGSTQVPSVFDKEHMQDMLDDVKDNEEELEEFVKQLQDLENNPELAGVDLPTVEDLENLSPEELEEQANKLIDAAFEEVDEVSQWPPVEPSENGGLGSTEKPTVYDKEQMQDMLNDVKNNEEDLEEFVKQLQDLENNPELAGVDLPTVEDLESLSPEELEEQAKKLLDAAFSDVDAIEQWPPHGSSGDESQKTTHRPTVRTSRKWNTLAAKPAKKMTTTVAGKKLYTKKLKQTLTGPISDQNEMLSNLLNEIGDDKDGLINFLKDLDKLQYDPSYENLDFPIEDLEDLTAKELKEKALEFFDELDKENVKIDKWPPPATKDYLAHLLEDARDEPEKLLELAKQLSMLQLDPALKDANLPNIPNLDMLDAQGLKDFATEFIDAVFQEVDTLDQWPPAVTKDYLADLLNDAGNDPAKLLDLSKKLDMLKFDPKFKNANFPTVDDLEALGSDDLKAFANEFIDAIFEETNSIDHWPPLVTKAYLADLLKNAGNDPAKLLDLSKKLDMLKFDPKFKNANFPTVNNLEALGPDELKGFANEFIDAIFEETDSIDQWPPPVTKDYLADLLKMAGNDPEKLLNLAKKLEMLKFDQKLKNANFPTVDDLEGLGPDDLKSFANEFIDAIFDETDSIDEWPPVVNKDYMKNLLNSLEDEEDISDFLDNLKKLKYDPLLKTTGIDFDKSMDGKSAEDMKKLGNDLIDSIFEKTNKIKDLPPKVTKEFLLNQLEDVASNGREDLLDFAEKLEMLRHDPDFDNSKLPSQKDLEDLSAEELKEYASDFIDSVFAQTDTIKQWPPIIGKEFIKKLQDDAKNDKEKLLDFVNDLQKLKDDPKLKDADLPIVENPGMLNLADLNDHASNLIDAIFDATEKLDHWPPKDGISEENNEKNLPTGATLPTPPPTLFPLSFDLENLDAVTRKKLEMLARRFNLTTGEDHATTQAKLLERLLELAQLMTKEQRDSLTFGLKEMLISCTYNGDGCDYDRFKFECINFLNMKCNLVKEMLNCTITVQSYGASMQYLIR